MTQLICIANKHTQIDIELVKNYIKTDDLSFYISSVTTLSIKRGFLDNPYNFNDTSTIKIDYVMTEIKNRELKNDIIYDKLISISNIIFKDKYQMKCEISGGIMTENDTKNAMYIVFCEELMKKYNDLYSIKMISADMVL